MLSEISPEVVYAVATGVGAFVGAGAEYQAVKQAAKQEEEQYYPALQIAIQEEAAETQNPAPELTRRQQLSRWASRNAIRTVLPITAAVGLGLAVHSFISIEQPQKATDKELVVDDSGATRPVIGQIKEVVSQFDHTNAEAVVGNIGQVAVMPSSRFSAYTETTQGAPAGEAPLSQQVSLALNKVAESNTKNHKADGRIVIITNGNRVGSINDLAASATQQHTAIYTVNVERKGTPRNLVGQLEKLSRETGGQFWSANSHNLSSVAKDVKETTTPDQARLPQPDRWPERISGILALFGAGIVYRNRKRLPTGKNAKGE